jgi:hypothetical protein
MAQNITCTFIDQTARTARALETPNADFTNGMNNGGCQPGIGIAVGSANLDGESASWTLLDQNGATRQPQDGQSIGGVALGIGSDAAATASFSIVTPTNTSGDGVVTVSGAAHLVTLAAGWVAV